MKSENSHGSGHRRGRRGSRKPGRGNSRQQSQRETTAPAAKSLWQKFLALFTRSPRPSAERNAPANPPRPERKPEQTEVVSPKLYIGNLSYQATESDLLELMKGVGSVRNAEIASHKYNEKSKGFGFVTMSTIDEARRAVVELHDKEFMGRKLVVSGAKSGEREPNYRR